MCEVGRISTLTVDNRSIFQVEELPEGSPLRWLYRLANALHITIRQSFILREVLFEDGDCLNPLLLDESGRLLRLYPFIGTADVSAELQRDRTYHVLIETRVEKNL